MKTKKIEPKQFVINTFKLGNGARIKDVLDHYYRHVNYYKKERKPEQGNILETAQDVFKDSLNS